jgi:beta-glucanase (GH16 family)
LKQSVATWALAALAVVVGTAAVFLGTRASNGPSTTAKPSGDLPGWHRVFADDFTGSSLDSAKWGAYEGQPGGDPGGWWDPSHVVVHHGMVELQTYRDPRFGSRWVSGGMSSAPAVRQAYGKYLVRFRVDAGAGIAAVLLLWPSADGSHAEIDFAENGGGRRNHMSATLHYDHANGQIQRSVNGDFTHWHTIGVEWRPGRLAYTLDGNVWAALASRHVPRIAMEMDAQTQAGTCGDQSQPCPNATTPSHVNMQIDWVVVYRPA